MDRTSLSLVSSVDGLVLAAHRWASGGDPVAVVQIAHGVAEHAQRYERLASALTAAGYLVYANDHRGHGASVGGDVVLGSFGAAGWPALIADTVTFSKAIRADNPGLPLFLLGHSMGSFAAQQIVIDHSDRYRGVILSGSTALDLLAQGLAASEGPIGLTAFNAAFEHRTGYEWLSRDEIEVDRYVADPLSGFELAEDLIPQLFSQAGHLADPAALSGIRRGMPFLVASGSDDPICGNGQLVDVLARRYQDAGADVALKLYSGARHEIFNETNRDEVTADVIAWLDAHR